MPRRGPRGPASVNASRATGNTRRRRIVRRRQGAAHSNRAGRNLHSPRLGPTRLPLAKLAAEARESSDSPACAARRTLARARSRCGRGRGARRRGSDPARPEAVRAPAVDRRGRRGGPAGAGGAAPRTKAAMRRCSRSRCGRSRSSTSCLRRSGAASPPAAGSLSDPRRPVLGSASCPTVRLSAPSRARGGDRARSAAGRRPLGLVRRAAPGAGLDPASPQRSLPRGGEADGGRLRPRLRRVLRRPDRAALVAPAGSAALEGVAMAELGLEGDPARPARCGG